jgi:hypothetical protein
VAAAPIQNEHGEPIGVLTVFSRGEDPDMADADFINRHLALAKQLSPIVGEYVAAEGALEFKPIDPGDAPGRESGSIEPMRMQ